MRRFSRKPAMLVTGSVALTIAALAAVAPAATSGAESARDPVKVTVVGHGSVLDGGALAVQVKVRCDPVGVLQEALVTASQDDNAIFGQGFFGGITCDGRPRVHQVTARTHDDAQFHAGKAYVSAFVLLSDDVSGDTFSGGDTRTIRVR